jgi:protease I
MTGTKALKWQAVMHVDHQPVLVPDTQDGEAQAYQHLNKADRVPADVPLDKADRADYHALVLPGGAANRDALRIQPTTVEFVSGISTVAVSPTICRSSAMR